MCIRDRSITSGNLWFPSPLFRYMHDFFCCFWKNVPRVGTRHIFEDRPTPFCIQKYYLLDLQLELEITIFVTLPVPTAPLFVRFGFCFALGANLGSTWVQLVPTWDQLRRPWAQFRPTWDPLGINLCHLVPKWGMRNVKSICFPLFFHIFLKCRPSCILCSTWAIFELTYCQLGVNFRQLRLNLEPTWVQSKQLFSSFS